MVIFDGSVIAGIGAILTGIAAIIRSVEIWRGNWNQKRAGKSGPF